MSNITARGILHKDTTVCDIFTAAGSSRRMGGVKKQFQKVAGKAVYEHARAFSFTLIGQVVLVAPQDDVETLKEKHANDTLDHIRRQRTSSFCSKRTTGAWRKGTLYRYSHAVHDTAICDRTRHGSITRRASGRHSCFERSRHIKWYRILSRIKWPNTDRSQLRRIQTPQFFESS